jgi:hypothetical protein
VYASADFGRGELCGNFVELCPRTCVPLLKVHAVVFSSKFVHCLINLLKPSGNFTYDQV